MPWDPSQYEKFQSQRSAPFYDLLDLVHVREGVTAIDLGCGTGELTQDLAKRLLNSQTLGIDTSETMLVKSKAFQSQRLTFQLASLDAIKGQWDVVFSNAAIQWVEDHERLIPKLFGLVKPGGQITIQLPSNHNHESHQLILELARSTPYREALNNWVRIPPVLSIEEYGRLLFESGAEDINVFEKIYPHVLEDSNAIAEWTSGTALVPYFERFSGDMKESFLAEYRAKLKHVFPGSPIFYPFRRILFSATKPA